MISQKKKAVIYCRVSTKEQVEEGNSLATQEKICRDYALKNGYEISQVFIELGESAKTADRTELKKLLAFCLNKKAEISALIIYRIDRLSRRLEDYTVIKNKLRQYAVEIKSTAEYFEDNPAGRFMENIIANVAQFDNDVRSERCVNGMRDAVREGRYVWNAPYGYKNDKVNDKPNIVPDIHSEIVKEAFVLFAKSNGTTEEIRHALIKKVGSNNSIKMLARSQFVNMLHNEIYAGWITQFGERNRGSFVPLISQRLYDKVQDIFKGRSKVKGHYRTLHPDFPLRKFIKHPSGIRLTGAWSKGRRKAYPYYFFRLPKHIYPIEKVDLAFTHLLQKHQYPSSATHKLVQHLKDQIQEDRKNAVMNGSKLSVKVSKLKERQTLLVQKNLDGILPDEFLKPQLESIEKEIGKIEYEIHHLSYSAVQIEHLFPIIKQFVEHPDITWKNANFKGKIMLQWLFFPEGVIYDGYDCRTPETCFIFKQKDDISSPYSCMVPDDNTKSDSPETTQLLTPHIPIEKIADELLRFEDILKQSEQE